jgi:hypothetical protein
VGLRVVTDGAVRERVEEVLATEEDLEVIERKQFSGDFNATKIILRYHIPRKALISRPPAGRALEVLRARHIADEDIPSAHRVFLETAESTVHLELLLTSYQELLESEIGRSMHEERVIAQRERQEYQASLAQNVEHLMEYLFAFCLSSKVHVGDLPIKLWVKYMPDYFDSVLMNLYDFPVGSMGLTM